MENEFYNQILAQTVDIQIDLDLPTTDKINVTRYTMYGDKLHANEKVMTLGKFPTKCCSCGKPYLKGQDVLYNTRNDFSACLECGKKLWFSTKVVGHVADILEISKRVIVYKNKRQC